MGLKRLLQFFYDDIKTDIRTVRQILNGEHKPKYSVRDVFRTIKYDWDKMITENWFWLIIIAFAFFSGMWVSSQHWQDECNEFILETYYPELLDEDYYINFLDNGTGNWSPIIPMKPTIAILPG